MQASSGPCHLAVAEPGSALLQPPKRTPKTRSFTLAQPPTLPTRVARKPVKRSKTYTGCWTCRDRGLKCDETRPECNKCLRSEISCKGYHVQLVWDEGPDTAKVVTRRTVLTEHSASQPVLSARDIQSALDTLDSSGMTESLQAGPFTVFPARQSLELEPVTSLGAENTPEHDTSCIIDGVDHILDESGLEDHVFAISQQADLEDLDFVPGNCYYGSQSGLSSTEEHENLRSWVDHPASQDEQNGEVARMMTSIKQKVLPQITSYLSSATLEERSLFHYWVTFLSGLMIPTQCHDNPFRTIFVPLALTRSDRNSPSSGNIALLHAIYSVSAFNLARLSPASERLLTLGTKHHKLALGHLRRNLLHHDESQREAVLATIITMSSIEVIKGDSCSWRTHLAGGRVLLQFLMNQDISHSTSTIILCQIFFCINALAVSSAPIVSDPDMVRGTDQWIDRARFEAEMQWPIWHTSYTLDRFFGLTKPVLEAIVRTNAFSNPTSNVTADEIAGLEQHIRRNDPDLMLTGLNHYDEIARHHSCAFFCACLIDFERRIRKTKPDGLQRIVQRSLDHLEAIRDIEKSRNLDVCGMFWPEFITACEAAEANNMRARAICIFHKGDARGIGNIQSAEQVVLEIWRRRDANPEDEDITWHEVMADLSLDLILT